MSQFVDEGTRTFQAGAAIAKYLRVKLTAGKLAVAGATDFDIGVMEDAATAADQYLAVRLRNAEGTFPMVASEAISINADVYGAAGGKVSDTQNELFIGTALQAASADGSIIEVLRQVPSQSVFGLGGIDNNLTIDEDFIGDWPASQTALTGQGVVTWSKVETNGLGVIPVDGANGILKFSADAVAEAATCSLYLANNPVDIDDAPIVEFIAGVFDVGDDAAVDFNWGMADDTHATDADLIVTSAFFHVDGADLTLLCESDDGTNETAATDTGVTLVDDTYYAFKIDMTDKTDVKFFYRAITSPTPAYTRLLSGTTFTMAAATSTLTPIVIIEKTSNDTTFDFRVDRIRLQGQRA